MAVFEYEVIERGGEIKKGEREAVTAEALQTNLAREGLFVIDIRRTRKGLVALARPRGEGGAPLKKTWTDALQGLTQRVKVTDLVLFTGQLAAMIDAGLHLLRSLTALAEETRIKHFKVAIEQVTSDVAGGQSLAQAMEKHPQAFNKFYVSLTRAGESSGRLPEVLNQLATYLEKVAQLRRKIFGALSYPLVILSFAMLILSAVVFYVVPIFEDVYKRVNAPLPLPTQTLITISRAIRSNIPITLLLIVGVGVLVYLWVRTDSGRRLLDRCKLRLPLFGLLIRKAAIAKVCRTLSTLLSSGLPVLEALEITASVAGNRVIEEAIHRTAGEIEGGGTIASSFRRSGEFPSMVTQMIATGEETGKLPELLTKIALYYEQQVDSAVAALASMIEPLMIVVVGGIAGAIVIALYLPIFNLGHAVRGGGGRL
jgi:type IV pilus assembly protein PilC